MCAVFGISATPCEHCFVRPTFLLAVDEHILHSQASASTHTTDMVRTHKGSIAIMIVTVEVGTAFDDSSR